MNALVRWRVPELMTSMTRLTLPWPSRPEWCIQTDAIEGPRAGVFRNTQTFRVKRPPTCIIEISMQGVSGVLSHGSTIHMNGCIHEALFRHPASNGSLGDGVITDSDASGGP